MRRNLVGACVAATLWVCHFVLPASSAYAAGYYVTIVNELDGRCLDADTNVPPNTPGGRVQMWECNASPQQLWYVEESWFNPRFVYLRNSYSGTCLTTNVFRGKESLSAEEAQALMGAPVALQPCDTSAGARGGLWVLPSVNNKGLFLASGGNLVLDYNPSTVGNGGQVYLWPNIYPRPPQQRWQFR